MNKSLLVGTVLGAIGVTAAGTMASYKMLNQAPEPTFAEVLTVKPVTETINTPRQECHDEVVTHQAQTKDPNKIAGSVIGAVVGGVLGNQVGDGKGKKLATLAGAAAGGYAGNRVQGDLQAKDTYTTTEQVCVTVNDSKNRVVGYDVEYQLADQRGSVRMAQKPGERIPVENGKLLLDPAAAGTGAH